MNFLELLDKSLDNIHYLMNHTEEEATVWVSLKMIVNDLEDSYSILYEVYTRKSLCERVQGASVEDFINSVDLDMLVKVFSDTRKYLYLTPMTRDLASGGLKTRMILILILMIGPSGRPRYHLHR